MAVNITVPLAGWHDNASLASKDFVVIGEVSISATETHRAGPLGLVTTVGGSKVTYTDLMQEAALIGADDIIDVRININDSGRASFSDWLKGWERDFTHTGHALAIRYVNGFPAETDSGKEKEAETEMEMEMLDFFFTR